MDDKQIDYIARHYRKGRFSAAAGWRRLGIARPSVWRRYRVAAAIAATVILSATATLIYYNDSHRVETTIEEAPAIAVNPMTEVKVIDFENAPLTDVVAKIEDVYGVKVNNLPDEGADYTLSLHYEGNPTDLIATINEILGTEMTVAVK